MDTWEQPNRLSGRRAVVTGANAGLGWEVARGLAARGASVMLACRSIAKADDARRGLLDAVPGADLEVRRLDLADLDSVAAFANAVLADGRLDLLVNNAGLMAIDESRTAQGVEMQFGVNHLGHYALTARLLPLLLDTPGSRVATMTSMGHRAARGELDPVLARPYDRWQAYVHSKLANLLFTRELDRRLRAASANVLAVAAHPGGSRTDLGTEGSAVSNRLMARVVPLMTQPAEAGARPMLRALTDPGLTGGELVGPRFVVRGRTPRVETPSRRARDDAAAAHLWAMSAELTGLEPAVTLS
ncbi:MAG: oxidoreductase [Dermatophilaceae bacterium]